MLLDLLQRHYDITLIKTGVVIGDSSRKPVEWIPAPVETLVDRVEKISVSPKQQTIHIKYKDGTSTLIEPSHWSYWTDKV
ncbi:hypothetical protein PCURB6_10630 [Paenibacillus curdlanolyticus]|nr:hypothetical protein PCURB6_10630 [Paenibacillus curdlanolyticus]